MIIIDALKNKKKSQRKPVWFMRQAGRYLPEYREIRKNFNNFIEFCQTPAAAAEVTLQPLRRFDLDAAIIFSDILIVPHALGCQVHFKPDHGPILDKINNEKALQRLHKPDVNVFLKTAEAIRITKNLMRKHHPNQALIGFAGAPWTVAAYMVEGGGSKNFREVIDFANQQPKLFYELIDTITSATIEYLSIQIEGGADIIKIFDSWASLVPQNLFFDFCIKPIAKIVETIKLIYPSVGIIGFPKGANDRIGEYIQMTNVDAIAVDQHIDIARAVGITNKFDVVIQGNFDNQILASGSEEQIASAAEKILQATENSPHIFNLGHGILPETPIKNVEKLISVIRAYESY